jgi:ribosomal protein S4
MAASKSEARRLIDQGGVKLNDRPVQSAPRSCQARTWMSKEWPDWPWARNGTG